MLGSRFMENPSLNILRLPYHVGNWTIGGEQRSYNFRDDPVYQGNGVYSWDFFVDDLSSP